MKKDFNKYRERHLAFWLLQDVKSPLLGFTVGAGTDSWSYWQYNNAAQKLFSRKKILPEDIIPSDFVDEQRSYLELSGQINDDIFLSAMPLASVPWMEAILGCPVVSTGSHLSAEKIIEDAESYSPVRINIENPRIKKYLEFIQEFTFTNIGKFTKDSPLLTSGLLGPVNVFFARRKACND